MGIALLAAGIVGLAHAADLPTTKAPAQKTKPNCWASFWDWLNASASDCPLSAYGVTLYGTLDLNATYLHEGVGKSPSADKVNYGIQRNAYESRWLAGYNGLSTSVIGLKMKEEVLPYGWSLIGVLEAGVNPYSGMFFNGPRSLADNNARPANAFPFQTANFDGSRAGQWDNSQGYLGLSNPVYGTLTFGRTNSLALDVTSAYDPVASTAFSTLGFSAAFAGFGTSPTARPNTAFTYRLTYQNFRAAVQAQIGGYGVGNATNGMYQGQLGLDFGSLSADGVLSWAKDAVALSSFSGSNIACLTPANCFINVNNQLFDPNTVLRATLSNNFGAELVARYKWDPFTFYGGWIYARLMNPSDDYLTGFPTISQGIFVPPGFLTMASSPTRRSRLTTSISTGSSTRSGPASGGSCGAISRLRRLLLSGSEQLQHQPLHGLRPLHQQQQMRWKSNRNIVPARLEAGQACRSLRRRLGQQRLRRLANGFFRPRPSSSQERPRPSSIRRVRRTTTRRSAFAVRF